eukprot:COSAG06_NODE_46425_length_347_cov_0.625000_1_plen_58_part_00
MHARRECVRGMEGIVRHARSAQPEMDIVVTHFVNEGGRRRRGRGRYIRCHAYDDLQT